jgi:aminoglycoside 6'-N-acetyltransferase I
METRLLHPGDEPLLTTAADGVFDHEVRPDLAAEFLADPRHHIAVAIEEGKIVGMASAVHYIHPDKSAELWINEVAVAGPYRRRGIAQALLNILFDHARALGCREAWVLTEPDNAPANALYRKVGGVPEEAVMYAFELTGAQGER